MAESCTVGNMQGSQRIKYVLCVFCLTWALAFLCRSSAKYRYADSPRRRGSRKRPKKRPRKASYTCELMEACSMPSRQKSAEPRKYSLIEYLNRNAFDCATLCALVGTLVLAGSERLLTAGDLNHWQARPPPGAPLVDELLRALTPDP